jgi:dCMP deaminase
MSRYFSRPSLDDYYMQIAWAVSRRGNCIRRVVGALIVDELGIISNGYNGTPSGMRNCNEGGCPRCISNALRHEGYNLCLCIHAEQNAIILAARAGKETNGKTLYTTLRPCLDCLKIIVQAGICEIVYDRPFKLTEDLEETYQILSTQVGIRIRRHPLTQPLTMFTHDIEVSQ